MFCVSCVSKDQVKQGLFQSEKKEITSAKVAGLVLLVSGVAMLVIAAILASGHFGGGAMFFMAGALPILSIPVLSVSAYYLMNDQR